MKRRVILLIMSLCLLMLMGGCSKKKEGTESEGTKSDKAIAKKNDYKLEDYITLGKYKGVEVTLDPIEITDEDIDKELKSQMGNSLPVESGDTVNIDYKGYKDGVAFEGGTGNYDLLIGSGAFIPGFEDQLIGAKAKQLVKVNVTFPKEYQEPSLAGQAVVFDVTINSISKAKLPELTEDFVKTNTSYKSIDEFKTSVRKTLEDKNAETQKNNKINAVYQAIKEGSKISSLPQSVTDFYTKQATDYYTELATKNKMDLDSFLQANNITKDQFNAKIADDTNAIATQELIIKSIAKAENLKLTDDEYQKGLADMVKDYGFDSNEEFTKKYGTEFVKEALMQEKVINFVADQAVEK